MQRLKWWQDAVFYQIYPRSFADSNEDGIGDMEGITQKLDYLKDLGIDAIWLSPHYPSPLYDCGYDISDYMGVAPEYGTLADFKRFLDAAHRRELRVILDLVLNHTSDQHPWFLESRASRENPKRDWYIWRDAKPDGSPPNNWNSTFGGSAWEWDEASGQYFYHFFFKQQPDLNWRNPEVKEAMLAAARFWLDLGVDGYRLDAIGTIFEDPDMRDQDCPVDHTTIYRMGRQEIYPSGRDQAMEYWTQMFGYQHDLPEVHGLMRELRAVVDEYEDRVLVGETEDILYCGNGRDELQMVFNFPLLRLDRLTPELVRLNQAARLSCLPPGGWPGNTFGNHDVQRVYTHFADGQHDGEWARLSLALLLTLRGTPFLYNGEEIGMTDTLIQEIGQFKDMLGVWAYQLEMEALGASPQEALEYAARFGRDKCRTPIQWRNVPNGGFCPAGVKPWLPVNPNYACGINVEEQDRDPNSLLNYYRRILKLRKNVPALAAGEYIPLDNHSKQYLAFLRKTSEQSCMVILNMSGQPAIVPMDPEYSSARVLFSSQREQGVINPAQAIELAPFEVFIAELE